MTLRPRSCQSCTDMAVPEAADRLAAAMPSSTIEIKEEDFNRACKMGDKISEAL